MVGARGDGEAGIVGTPPRMLGRYELLGTLGTGGMATVHLARIAGEAGFQRLFAIKVLHAHLAGESGFISMFLDEARIAAMLHHPNIVPIIDLGNDDGGTPFVAMEYIEGCSLSALLKRHKNDRPPKLVAQITLDLLAGLDAAHTLADDSGQPLNVVHRDVSPQNVLVGIDGSARITDFGIARAEARINTTRPGQMKGKIAYMSPEQIRGGSIDRRTDLWAAGGMLWAMLTGRKLFVGANEAATMANILELEIPKPSTIGLKPPAAFDAVCARALERDPEKRFASAQEFEDALREAAMTIGGPASRRELKEWVASSFREELAARREAIKSAASSRASRMMPVTELPSLTPSAASLDSSPRIPTGVDTMVDDHVSISITRSAPRGRRIALIAGIPLLAVAAVVLWMSRSGSSEPARSAPQAPVAAPMPAAPPVPAAPPSVQAAPPPVQAAPTAAPAPPAAQPAPPPPAPEVAAPEVAAPEVAAPEVAAPVKKATPVAKRPPARRPAAVHRTAPPPPAPAKPAPATQPAPSRPAPARPWDPDSPLPPP